LANPVKLTVVSLYGTPNPFMGNTFYESGTIIACSVSGSPVTTMAGTRRVLAGWTGTGDVSVSGVTSNTGSFAITQDSTIEWNWDTEYELTLSSAGGGSVNSAGGWYDDGDTVILTATPSSGYEFTHWSEDIVSGDETNNPVTVTMDKARNIVANFQKILVPIGGIIMYHGDVSVTHFDVTGLGVNNQVGWALCNGANGTPNLKGQFIAGYDPDVVDYNALDKIGGAATHALSVAEMAAHDHGGGSGSASGGSHSHSGSTSTDGNHGGHGTSSGTGGPSGAIYHGDGTRGNHSHSVSVSGGDHGHTISVNINSEGSGTAHENRPQFYVLAYIKRIS